MTSQHLECLVAAQCCSVCRVMKRNHWDEKQVWWAPDVVKHKKRISWLLDLAGNLDRPPKWDKDLQSSEPEVGCADTVTSGVRTSSALELVSSALFTWKSIPKCDSSHLK